MANRLSLAIRALGLDVNEEESMTQHDKLVRDRIPEIVRAHGSDLEFRYLEPAERPLRLTDKLAEECTEYQESGEIGELVDVVEVVHAIIAASGLTWEVFEEMRLAKRAARGGFDDGVLLIRAERSGNPYCHSAGRRRNDMVCLVRAIRRHGLANRGGDRLRPAWLVPESFSSTSMKPLSGR